MAARMVEIVREIRQDRNGQDQPSAVVKGIGPLTTATLPDR
jgi:hypothetical protein